MADDDYRDDEYDYDPDDAHCLYCSGEGWGILGQDFTNTDPLNEPDGQWVRCPCCGGSGRREDMTFW